MKFHRNQDERRGRRRGWRGVARRPENPTPRPDLEPAHDQPWVPRSGLIDRLRRSARR